MEIYKIYENTISFEPPEKFINLILNKVTQEKDVNVIDALFSILKQWTNIIRTIPSPLIEIGLEFFKILKERDYDSLGENCTFILLQIISHYQISIENVDIFLLRDQVKHSSEASKRNVSEIFLELTFYGLIEESQKKNT